VGNTLAYYDTTTIAAVKSFITQALEVNVIQIYVLILLMFVIS